MTIGTFLQKAIEGGWPNPYLPGSFGDRSVYSVVLLDPEAWKAVGKVEGWDTGKVVKQTVPALQYRSKKGKLVKRPETTRMMTYKGHAFVWKKNMHRMIDALAEGKTVEEFLAQL